MKSYAFVLFVSALLLCSNLAGNSIATVIYQNQFNQPIPSQGDGMAWMKPVTLFVPDYGMISDLDVLLDISHTNVIDLCIFLDSPQGKTVILKDDELMNHFWRDTPKTDMKNTIFDDAADHNLLKGIPPYNGRFKPATSNYLSLYNGLDAYGEWTLRIYDMAYADTGALNRWELHIEYHINPEPLIFCYLAASSLFFRHRTRRSTPS